MNIHHYVISGWTPEKQSGLDNTRKDFLIKEFSDYGLDMKYVTWMEGNNKDDLTDDMVKKIYLEDPENPMKRGEVSCTYKHYLALMDIVENDRPFAVIMEDDVCFKKNIPDMLKLYLDELEQYHPEWNVLFDGDINLSWGNFTYYYDENIVLPNKRIYKKDNSVKRHFNSYNINYPMCGPSQGIIHGSTRGANYYIVNNRTARILLKYFLPFNRIIDHWYNHLFHTFGFSVFWSEPQFVHKMKRRSTLQNDD